HRLNRATARRAAGKSFSGLGLAESRRDWWAPPSRRAGCLVRGGGGGAMGIAHLGKTRPEGGEVRTLREAPGFCVWPGCARGCRGGGVYQEAGSPGTALYVEIWEETAQLETHVRSRGYDRLLAIMETAAARPELRFNFVAETRGLEWVEQLRLGTTTSTTGRE